MNRIFLSILALLLALTAPTWAAVPEINGSAAALPLAALAGVMMMVADRRSR